jgi:chloramphenicol 3-O-phosphotransferase
MIIFLNGTINAGKTTVAKILVSKLPNTALVEIDALREMIDWMPIDKAVPINLENAVSVIKNFSKHSINSIVPYPLTEKNYTYISHELADLKDTIKVFTLSPNMEKALTNRGTRELSPEEKDRVKYLYSIGIHEPSFGETIDNSNQTPEETADYILQKIIE